MAQRLLVIEDEPTLARLLSYNLTQEGYEVTVEDHGTAGYDRATREPFDLIVLDLMLPGMNGIDILDKLRGQGIRTPVIVLTAKNAEEDVVRGLKSGADDYITKPFGVSELLARVSAVLRRISGLAEEAPRKRRYPLRPLSWDSWKSTRNVMKFRWVDRVLICVPRSLKSCCIWPGSRVWF